jgi:uncharacterized protein (TIGR02246 family)
MPAVVQEQKATTMTGDDEAIRDVVTKWHSASQAGDLDTVLGLMTDDALFLLPGREPMTKAEFAAISQTQTGAARPKIVGDSQILELVTAGDWAFIRTRISVTVTPADGG